MNPSAVRIHVPASTSNIGPGFDCLGLALDLWNSFEISVSSESSLELTGPESDGLHNRGRRNPLFRAAAELAAAADRELPPLAVRVEVRIPNARGLGSSSTAIVAGLLAADALLELRTPLEELLRLAVRLEGHPDNVCPALLGGLVHALLVPSGRVIRRRALPHPDLRYIALSPHYHTSTRQARSALPEKVSFRDAVSNAARVPLLFDALVEGRTEDLADLTRDRLHEHARSHLFKGFQRLKRTALDAGAAAVVLSGAGPTMLAITASDREEAVAKAWQDSLTVCGGGTVRRLGAADRGVWSEPAGGA